MLKFIIIMLTLTINANAINWKRFDNGCQRYSSFIQRASAEYRLDTTLIQAIIEKESHWNPKASGTFNCNGLMQVQGGSFNPERNIIQGCSILRRCIDAYKGNIIMALTAYNSGIAGARKLLRQKRTLVYARDILKIYRLIIERR